MHKISLPELNKAYHEIVLPNRIEGDENINQISELNILIRDIKSDKNLPLKMSTQLLKPDMLIKIAKEDLKKRKVYASHGLEGLYGTSNGVFNIYVSKNMIKRALIFSDAFIKLMKKRGHSVEVRTNESIYNGNGTKVILYGEVFEICVRETRKRIKVKSGYGSWMRTDYVPTGVLTLRIEDIFSHQWSDSKTVKLEDKLANILAYFELRAIKEKKERIEREIRHKEYERKKKIEEEYRKKRDDELEEFKSVISHSSRWQKAMDLRNYIAVVERNAIEKNTLTHVLKEWLKWIKDKADWYDPLIEKEDELFKNIDRNSI